MNDPMIVFDVDSAQIVNDFIDFLESLQPPTPRKLRRMCRFTHTHRLQKGRPGKHGLHTVKALDAWVVADPDQICCRGTLLSFEVASFYADEYNEIHSNYYKVITLRMALKYVRPGQWNWPAAAELEEYR